MHRAAFAAHELKDASRAAGTVGLRTPKIVALTGEIDIYTAATACRALDAIDGPAVIDLSGVRLLCAAGLNELARVAGRVGHGTVTLAGARPHVRRVLQIARFDMLFTIEESPSGI